MGMMESDENKNGCELSERELRRLQRASQLNGLKTKWALCEEAGKTSTRFPVRSQTWLRDNYLGGRQLGQGAFGTVFLHYSNIHKVNVAVKKFLPDRLANGRPELQMMKLIRAEPRCHVNLPCLLDYFKIDNDFYIVSTHVPGTTLQRTVESLNSAQRNFSSTLFTMVASNVLNGLRFLHQNNIAHTDVKPDNIIVHGANRNVVLIDLGLACLTSKPPHFPPCTRLGNLVFTSPELVDYFSFKDSQWERVHYSKRLYTLNDVYALGLCLLNLASARKSPNIVRDRLTSSGYTGNRNTLREHIQFHGHKIVPPATQSIMFRNKRLETILRLMLVQYHNDRKSADALYKLLTDPGANLPTNVDLTNKPFYDKYPSPAPSLASSSASVARGSRGSGSGSGSGRGSAGSDMDSVMYDSGNYMVTRQPKRPR